MPVEGLAEFKSSVDDLRLRLWGLMSAGTANDYRAFQERFRLRRTREICEGVAGELRAGTLSNRHDELGPLAEAASDLARTIVSVAQSVGVIGAAGLAPPCWLCRRAAVRRPGSRSIPVVHPRGPLRRGAAGGDRAAAGCRGRRRARGSCSAGTRSWWRGRTCSRGRALTLSCAYRPAGASLDSWCGPGWTTGPTRYGCRPRERPPALIYRDARGKLIEELAVGRTEDQSSSLAAAVAEAGECLARRPALPGERAAGAERRAGVSAPPHEIVQHLVADDHLVHGPVRGEEDLVAGVPVAHALPAGAGEALTRHDHPLDAVEIAAQAGARLGLLPPLPIDGGRLPRLASRGIESAGAEEDGEGHERERMRWRTARGRAMRRADRRDRSQAVISQHCRTCLPTRVRRPPVEMQEHSAGPGATPTSGDVTVAHLARALACRRICDIPRTAVHAPALPWRCKMWHRAFEPSLAISRSLARGNSCRCPGRGHACTAASIADGRRRLPPGLEQPVRRTAPSRRARRSHDRGRAPRRRVCRTAGSSTAASPGRAAATGRVR